MVIESLLTGYNSNGQRVKMALRQNGALKLTRHYLGGFFFIIFSITQEYGLYAIQPK